MENTNDGKYSGYFSKKLKAGKRRTYFFDVRSTKQGDFFLTITESKKRFEGDGYDSHKIFLYKEDFKKFVEALNESVNYIKTELLPDYDYDAERPSKPFSNTDSVVKTSEPVTETSSETPSVESQKDSPPTTTTNPSITDDEQVDWK